MPRIAGALGCTEGQAYTLLLGIVMTVAAALLGLPPTMRDIADVGGTSAGGGVSAAPPPPPSSDTPSGAPELAPPPVAVAAAPLPTGDGPAIAASPAPTAVVAPAPPAPPAAATGPSAPTATAPTGFGAAQLAARVGDPGAPDGVAVDGTGRLLVATNNALIRGRQGPSKVIRYGADGKVDDELVVQGQAATRTSGLTGLALAADGTVLALDAAPARVLRLDLDRGRQATLAALADLPACAPTAASAACEHGADDRPEPRDLVVDQHGGVLVSDSGQGVIWRVPPGGRAMPWFVFPDAEAASRPTGLALDPAGALLVATTVSLQPSAGAGQVQRIAVGADGGPGERTTVAEIEPLSGPMGLAVTPGGGIVVALATADAVVLLGPDGAERARLTADQVAAAAGVPLDGPTGLALRGRSLVVTNQSPTANDASHWVVFDVPLT
jgi:sugar lactone lactonase YvrE